MAARAPAKAVKEAAKSQAKKKKIAFKFYAPQARKVCLAGTFNSWNEQELKKDAQGYWTLALTLGEGRYEYRFIVDSGWANDQENVECVPNSFGTWNSVIQVKI